MLPDTYLGPVVSHKQQETILNYLQIGQQEGAKLAAGGEYTEAQPTKRASTSSRPFC